VIDISILLQIIWTGLATSTYSVLFAVAFSLVLKVSKVWNFAQAGIMGLSFYVMYTMHIILGLPLLASVGMGLIATIAASVCLDRFGLQTLRNRNSPGLTFFIFTLVVSEFLAYLLAFIFGTEPVALTKSIMSGVNIVSGVVISNWDIQAVCLTIIVLLALYLFIRRTRDGQFLAAVADNPDLSRFYGINVKRAYIITFVIAAVLITVGMYLFGTRASIIPNTPLQMMLFAVISTLLGGMGRIFGAALAAIGLTLVQGLSIFVIPSQWQGLILYVFLFVTILFFPRGVSFQTFKKLTRSVQKS